MRGTGKCSASHGTFRVHHGRCSSRSYKKGSGYVFLFPGFHELSLVVFVCSISSPSFPGVSKHFGLTFLSWLRLMLVGIWLGLYWVLFSYFDHYIISGEVIGFRLFRATGLAFAIRPKDGVARQGRRPCRVGGWHCGRQLAVRHCTNVLKKILHQCSQPHWIKDCIARATRSLQVGLQARAEYIRQHFVALLRIRWGERRGHARCG